MNDLTCSNCGKKTRVIISALISNNRKITICPTCFKLDGQILKIVDFEKYKIIEGKLKKVVEKKIEKR